MDKEILQLMARRLAKMAAAALVMWLINKGYLTPDGADETTARLAETFAELALLIIGVVWAGKDAIREKKRVDTEQQRTSIALELPAHATHKDVEAILKQSKEGNYDTQP